MLSRRSTIIFDLFIALFNFGVATFHALRIYGGDLRTGVLVGMLASTFVGILILLMMLWYLRECAHQDRALASLLMQLVYGNAKYGRPAREG